MSVALAQTATATTPLSVGCSGGTLNADAIARVLVPGGTVGSQTASFSHAAAATTTIYAAFITNAAALDFHTWAAGTWVTRWNVSTANMNLVLEAVHICRLNSAGTSQATIGSATALGLSMGATGVITVNVTGTAQTFAAGDRVAIYMSVRNTTTMTQASGFTFNQSIATPIAPPKFTQSACRFRNDDGSETGATWAAALNTGITHPVAQRLRVRCEVTNNGGVGSTALGWQYNSTAALVKLADPTALPSGGGLGVAWSGDYLAVAHNLTPYLSFYKRDGETLVKLADPTALAGSGRGVAWSGDYLAVVHATSPFLSFYKRDGETLVKLAGPTALPGSGYGVAWNEDYLAVAHNLTPSLSFYKRDGETLVKLADPTALAGLGYAVAWSGDYLAVAHATSPFLSFYKRDGETLVKLADPTALPGTGYGVAWSGDYLAVAHATSPFLSFYKRDGETLVKLAGPTALPGLGYAVAWSGDYLAVAHSTSPFLSFYKRDGETLVKLAGPTALPGTGYGVAWNEDYLAVGHATSPFLSFYKLSGWSAVPEQGTSGVPVRFANSPNLTDAATTTQQISSGTFVAGRVYESQHTTQVVLTSGAKTELEAVVEVVDAAVGTPIQFRVVREV
jgi:hypothetical protein